MDKSSGNSYSYKPLDWNNYGSSIVDDLLVENNKYGIKFDFDKEICQEIIKEVVHESKISQAAICGGFFTRNKNIDIKDQTADVFIYDGGKYFINTETHLNSLLNIPFNKIEFDDLGKIAPGGVVAKKKGKLKNNQKVTIYFTHIPFPKNDLSKYQLLDLFEIQPSKIMYYGGNREFYLNNWFSLGGSIVAENKNPNQEFIRKYKNKGFDFEGDYFVPKFRI